MTFIHPYAKPTKEELEAEQKQQEAVERKIKGVANAAKRCLSSELFADYKKKLIIAREGIISLMKTCVEPDPMKYALIMKSLVTKIDTLDMLGDLIEEDKKRRV